MKITQQTEASLEYTHKDTPTSMGRKHNTDFCCGETSLQKTVPKITFAATLYGHLAEISLTPSKPSGKANVISSRTQVHQVI